jgi:hypothetical protein
VTLVNEIEQYMKGPMSRWIRDSSVLPQWLAQNPRVANAAVETLATSGTYATLATPDAVSVVVRNDDVLRIRYRAHWKISAVAGTQQAAFFIGGVQLQYSANGGAPVGGEVSVALGTFYSHLISIESSDALNGGLRSIAGAVADVSNVSTGQLMSYHANSALGSGVDVVGLAPGVYTVDVRFKTSAGTLSVRERFLDAKII